MDGSAPSKVDADINDVYAYFLKIENSDFPTPLKQRSTVIKYTKLPEFDFESKGSWFRQSYSLQPRLRRIIALEEPGIVSSRSVKTATQSNTMATNLNRRKIVTICEDEEYDPKPKFSKKTIKYSSVLSNKSTGTEAEKEKKEKSHRTTSHLTTSTKYSKETTPGVKINNTFNRKEVTSKSNYNNQHSVNNQGSVDKMGSRKFKEKETVKKTKSALSRSNVSVSKNFVTPSESKQSLIIKGKSYEKSKNCENLKNNTASKKCVETPQKSSQPSSTRCKASFLIELNNKNKHLPVIHVPLDRKYLERDAEIEVPSNSEEPTIVVYTKPDGTIDTDVVVHKNINTETEPLAKTVDQVTDMEGFEPEIIYKCVESTDVQTDLIEETFDNLDIPNVTLKKDGDQRKEEQLDLHGTSLTNVHVPPESLKISDNRNEKSVLDAQYCKSTSYVFCRSTLTYRTQQEINYHVVGSNQNVYTNQSPSPLTYPMNVVSVFKEEMSANGICNNISLKETRAGKSSKDYKNCINEIKSLDCSYEPDSNHLMKPSDILSTITVNNSVLQSVYTCEQFQRELHFIDSFFESLQYLESCSLTEKCFVTDDVDHIVENQTILDSELTVKNSEYDSFLSKIESGANSDNYETMASKNLFLLNILIRDEQRRAKNFLCVLKKREDALKDFTKSQILYLENKKKQDKTDISALKKKQRGALVKLQHECGEMQRMRKALLQLSEKREIALMKTKKDLELKLKNNADVEQIIKGKRKLKRTTAVDRSSVPVKCFDLSSSGGEDSNASRYTSEDVASPLEAAAVAEPALSAEKSSQTGDVAPEPSADRSTDTAAENFVVVDGSYLNILFHNLSLPQIFSGGKQYEVNEDALKNIVDSTNSLRSENWGDMIEKLMDQVNNGADRSSSPSTARSLVEEFEQYYKTLGEEDRSPKDKYESPRMYETSDAEVQASMVQDEQQPHIGADESQSKLSMSSMTADCIEPAEDAPVHCESQVLLTTEEAKEPPTGPLLIPVGAAYVVEMASLPTWPAPKSYDSTLTDNSASSAEFCERVSSVSSLAEPPLAEAEELRRQQLAIEREIKELEQQQCRLLVREIPDKPPPPYTPPADARAQPPRAFQPDDVAHHWIRNYIDDPLAEPCEPGNAFNVLVHDFCKEAVARHKLEQSDKPWDSYNLLPQKQPLEPEQLYETTSTELVEVLTPATPTVVSGVSSRRSDHIDDILFEQWRRVEPEWTSLHADEAIVKNQLFETIFQRILTETVDEYKRTVLSPEID